MAKQSFLYYRVQKGMTYREYIYQMAEKAARAASINLEDDPLLYYTRLNFQRSSRIQKTYRLSAKLQTLIRQVEKPQLWMVLTEDWCGDSAQSLPIIAKMTEYNRNIHLRILPRDENPDIMDHYLTNGTRGIPKLVAFNETGNELFTWGPRPAEAAELYKRLKMSGKEREEIYRELQKWYTRDRGKSLEKEFIGILENLLVR